MPKNLVIVESPTKSKTLAKFLGRKFSIKATKGHLIDLPKTKLGIDLEDNYNPQYMVIKGKSPIIKDLLAAAKKVDNVYLAPDPDREGEAIAYHVASKLEKSGAKIYRAAFNEITKKAVLGAIENASEIDMDKVNAQQARRLLDRIVGYKVSPVLWKTVCRGLSAGRVQSVALRIICEREQEIRDFEVVEYWKFNGIFTTDKDEKFKARLHKVDNQDFNIPSEEDANKLKEEILKEKFQVGTVKTEKRKRKAYPPYTTSSIQQDASVRLHYAPNKTMRVAQSLYEGVELGDQGSIGLITYMRTDSVRIAGEAVAAAKDYICDKYGDKYYPEKPNFYKSKKSAQDAHEAIRPTYLTYPPEEIKKYLNRDQFRLYELIWNRFLASQMSQAMFENLTIDIIGGKFNFRVSKQKVVFDGFLKVYSIVKEDNGNGKDEENRFPDLKKDDNLSIQDVEPTQHFTKPPPRFSEASLVKELEGNGIGRPSTYAQIIQTLKTRKYTELEQRRLTPTELGETVNSMLLKLFPNIFSIEFTANMETELDKVEEGNSTWRNVLDDFYQPFSQRLDTIDKTTDEIKKSTQKESDFECEKCGRKMIEKWGRNGKFLACSGYPECSSTMPIDGKKAEEIDEKCDLCGSPMIIKEGRFGRFIACTGYPKCKNTKSISLGIKCPKDDCEGEIVGRKTKRGKSFWGCSKYPDCDFASWYKPVTKKCPNCNNPFMVEKDTKRDGFHHACLECKHKVIPQQEEAESQV